jgi:hypothetical protein
MSSRPILSPFQVITNGAMVGNLTSIVSVIQNLSMLSYAASWTGATPVGTLSVQVSNDYSQYADGSVNNPGTWTTMILNVGGVPSPTVPVTGSPGTAFIDIDQTAAYAMRLIYTAGSGTGSLQAFLNGKVA